jgi:hypothetical protein
MALSIEEKHEWPGERVLYLSAVVHSAPAHQMFDTFEKGLLFSAVLL